ncbi:MAG: sigma 54-interacting transcriptional regulator [Deltaproteobacteria bacterium]|nr:sigma 54-interacting transcriptional regulator [Deltaproteobacteria bacterium]
MAELVFYRRGEELMRVSLEHPKLSLGRGPQNDVAIPDNQVSRQQATVERRGGKAFLVDLSGRGTSVDGAMKNEVELHDGSEISLGDWRAVFHASARGSAGPTEVHNRLDGTSVMDRGPGLRPGEYLVRLREKSGERQLKFDADEISLGKDEENQVVLDDRFVSSFHARITRTGRGFWLRDLGSTNGTFVNGSRVREVEVEPGSAVRLGETELVLELPGPAVGDGVFQGMVGRDPSMQQLFDLIDRVAPAGVSVTVFGETGTGKELVARAIHARSGRRDRPFVPVNCSAIARELIESELFGHEKGAFTGADRQRIGAFEEAHGGTIFLDEIGELPLELQAKLLRTLENGEIKRVGSSKPITVDVRVVAATHRDLLARSRKGEFREDLYYRLCVFPLTLPPLRRRQTDLALLTDFFVGKFSSGARVEVTAAARQKLASHPFPGNIRELRNVIHRGLLLRKGSAIDSAEIVFDAPYTDTAEEASRVSEDGDTDTHLFLPGRTLDQVRFEAVVRAVRRNGGDKSAAARELKMSRSTVIKWTTEGMPTAKDEDKE